MIVCSTVERNAAGLKCGRLTGSAVVDALATLDSVGKTFERAGAAGAVERTRRGVACACELPAPAASAWNARMKALSMALISGITLSLARTDCRLALTAARSTPDRAQPCFRATD